MKKELIGLAIFGVIVGGFAGPQLVNGEHSLWVTFLFLGAGAAIVLGWSSVRRHLPKPMPPVRDDDERGAP